MLCMNKISEIYSLFYDFLMDMCKVTISLSLYSALVSVFTSYIIWFTGSIQNLVLYRGCSVVIHKTSSSLKISTASNSLLRWTCSWRCCVRDEPSFIDIIASLFHRFLLIVTSVIICWPFVIVLVTQYKFFQWWRGQSWWTVDHHVWRITAED